MGAEIITTPSVGWLEKAAAGCRSSIDIASPFVGNELCEFLKKVSSEVRVTLLTRTRLIDFASGASDINAVARIAGNRAKILGLDRLHAKVYVFDEQHALVTSANATFSGFRKNVECGISVDNEAIARSLGHHVRCGFAASTGVTVWSEAQLLSLVSSVERLKNRLPSRSQIRAYEDDETQTLELPKSEAEQLLPASAGWTQLVFQQLIRLNQVEFTTDEAVHACTAEIATRYPTNRHPREKIRQQLQVLRDLGLVQFQTTGHYRLTIVATG